MCIVVHTVLIGGTHSASLPTRGEMVADLRETWRLSAYSLCIYTVKNRVLCKGCSYTCSRLTPLGC